MDISQRTPQRVAVVVEQNKSENWSVAAYLVTADGQRKRRSLGVFKTYSEAAESFNNAWQRVSLEGG